MIYICSHKPEQVPYKIHCPIEIIDNSKSSLPEDYRHLRGMQQVLQLDLPDEIGIYQHRRFMEYGSIPEGYDCVVPKDFGDFNVRNQYACCHHIEDLDLCEEIINDHKFNEWIRRNGNTETYMHNLFIMRKDDYIQYCNFLFSVLNEYADRRGEPRDVAFLAERLGAYWIATNIPKEKRFITKTITLI